MSPEVSILILAAGASKRMQKLKQLLPWGDQSLIEHVIKTAISSKATNCHLLLGANKEEIRSKIKGLAVDVIENDEWEKGMGKGIAKGVQFILEKERPDAILIMLCDQPLIDSDYINQLKESFIENIAIIKIVGTRYKSKIGVPAIFSSSLFHELQRLDDIEGASKLIADNALHCISIDPQGKERDMDTWDDYINMRPE